MLRLPHSEICIALSPHRVSLVRRRPGWRAAILDKITVPCLGNMAEPWTNQLATLEGLIKQEAWNTGDAVVILSNHYARYLLVPWSDLLFDNDEAPAYVRHLFGEIYGEAAARHELRISSESPGAPRVASAVETDLVQGLREILAASRLRLRSIQPYFMSAYNLHRKTLGADGWFAVAEAGQLCVAGRLQNRWLSIRNLRAGPDWGRDLKNYLARQQISAGTEALPQKIYWCAAESQLHSPALGPTWSTERLAAKRPAGLAPDSESAFAIAAYA